MPKGIPKNGGNGGRFKRGHKVNLGKRNPLGKHWKLSKEVKKRMSIARKGKRMSDETRKKLSVSKMGHFVSNETKKKIADSKRGQNSHFWKGGITPFSMKIRMSLEYRLWRTAVFERDNYTCIWCGAKSGNGKRVVLNADHIKSFSQFPELRFAIDNGRTLCISCHYKTDNFGSKANNYLKKKYE